MQKEQNDFSERRAFDFLAFGPALCAGFSSHLGGCYMLIRSMVDALSSLYGEKPENFSLGS